MEPANTAGLTCCFLRSFRARPRQAVHSFELRLANGVVGSVWMWTGYRRMCNMLPTFKPLASKVTHRYHDEHFAAISSAVDWFACM